MATILLSPQYDDGSLKFWCYNWCHTFIWGGQEHAGPRFNIKMTSYWYKKSHCRDKTILRPSYLHNGISYTGKTTSLYWIGALVTVPADVLAPIGARASAKHSVDYKAGHEIYLAIIEFELIIMNIGDIFQNGQWGLIRHATLLSVLALNGARLSSGTVLITNLGMTFVHLSMFFNSFSLIYDTLLNQITAN